MCIAHKLVVNNTEITLSIVDKPIETSLNISIL